MDTGLFIALRYLFAKKSHNVINVISALSAIGMAIGTAALILILSIYNGFNGIITSNISDIDPDILVQSADGRAFIPDDALTDSLSSLPGINSISYVLEDNIFAVYGDRQTAAKAKGVDESFEQNSPIGNHITAGEFSLYFGQVRQAIIGAGLAYNMGINPRFRERLSLYYPKSSASSAASLFDLGSSVNTLRFTPSGLFSIGTDVDNELIIIPLEAMQKLLDKEGRISGIEILCDGNKTKSLIWELEAIFGEDFTVKDRYMQDPAVYKMMRYEKFAIFMILIFVVIIVAFNIFGSLSMLRMEKEKDSQSLRAMGAKESLIKRIFVLEGWLVSLCGLVCGLIIGIGLSLIQQHFGIIKMPQGFLVSAYPCILMFKDVAFAAAGIAAIGFLISFVGVKAEKTQLT